MTVDGAGDVTPPPAEMRVSTSTDPHALAGALIANVYGGNRVHLRAIGAGATAVAIKAVSIAGDFTFKRRGVELAFTTAWMTATGKRGDDLSGFVFEVFELDPAIKASVPTEKDGSAS